jgi:hypothetical protein
MPMLSVAPEGTLSHGRCLVTFKKGAFVAGVPVVPILLRYRLAPHSPAWTIITPWWHAVSARGPGMARLHRVAAAAHNTRRGCAAYPGHGCVARLLCPPSCA